MPQYRVRVRVVTESLVDLVADTPHDAMTAAVEAFGGTEDKNVEAILAELIAGQSVEPSVADAPPSKYAVALEGDEG